MYNATTMGKRLEYARCFVEIEAKNPLPQKISLELEGGEIVELGVEHEWTPPLCNKCISFGHLEAQCPTTKIWKPKNKYSEKPASSACQVNDHEESEQLSSLSKETLTNKALADNLASITKGKGDCGNADQLNTGNTGYRDRIRDSEHATDGGKEGIRV